MLNRRGFFLLLACIFGLATWLSGAFAQPLGLQPTNIVGKPLAVPFLLAGDGYHLWIAQPLEIDAGIEKSVGFQLLDYSVGATDSKWLPVIVQGRNMFVGLPRLLTLNSFPKGDSSGGFSSTALVMLDDGQLCAYGNDRGMPLASLPGGRIPVAMAAMGNDVWVLSFNHLVASAPATSATVSAREGVAGIASTAPATGAMASGTAPAGTMPEDSASSATATTQATTRPVVVPIPLPAMGPSRGDAWCLDRFSDGVWTSLESPGTAGQSGVPSPLAHPVLVLQHGRVWMIWYEGGAEPTLKTRQFEQREGGGAWLPVVETSVTEDLSELRAVTLDTAASSDPRVFVLWPFTRPAGAGVEVHGSVLTSSGALDTTRMLPPLSLGDAKEFPPGDGHLAISRVGNVLAVVTAHPPDHLVLRLFDANGKPLGGPMPVETPVHGWRDSVILQNLTLIVLVALVGFSWWQWRNRPMESRPPRGMRVASLGRRFGAAAIDFAIPVVVVFFAAGLYRNNGWELLITKWADNLLRPESTWLGDAHEILWILAGYIGHVTLGELFTCRSIGKALCGLRVVAMDGQRPALAALLIRNLIRIPELLMVVFLVYIFISEYRQRFGDVLARTLVAMDTPAGAPIGPTDEAPAEKAANEEESLRR